ALNQLQPSNIIALDNSARVKWQNLLYNATPPTTLPTISVSDGTVAEGNSGTSNLRFAVSLSKPSTNTVSVGYTTSNGTATAAEQDYTPTVGTVAFAPGETSKFVDVAVRGDTMVEPNETFTLNLSSPVNATLADAAGTGTIVNDDVDQAPGTPPVVSMAD